MKRKEIEQLQTAGLISAEQAVAIAEHFHLNGGRRWNWLVLSMSTLAGGLILGGIIMLISANWEIIPDLVKMEVTMALLLGFWVSTGARQRDSAAAMSGWVRWLFSLGFAWFRRSCSTMLSGLRSGSRNWEPLLMMKRVYLLFAVVAAQLLWLGWNYADRTREMAEAPVIYWKKEADGLHRVCRVETPGSAQDSPAAGETRALMWGDIVSDFDIEKEGEKIILVKQMAKLRLSFSRNH